MPPSKSRAVFNTFPNLPLRNMLVWSGILRRNFRLAADGFFGPLPEGCEAALADAAAQLERLDSQLRQSFEIDQSAPVVTGNGAARTHLTPRETEILRLMCAGYHNADIARKLHFGLGTIKAHVRVILEKLGATSRTEAATIAMRQGLVRPGGASKWIIRGAKDPEPD